ncbi:regulatory protein GemA [Sphingomonas sp. AR_OL41]|uniref:gp16 family protein n=1 Tax=Sphingomonas sp. AR_OL41 TaxID=3042729 RepID=UPI00248002EC|nr:regulatory protein GemA [Sphingomonas sp. AR_OL41]MDH7971756.1 regulatory protein GemA [Sphingomonas sp. AR_OL41]
MSAACKPTKAQFDPAAQLRRALIAKVHIAPKQLGMIDDDYRAVMLRVTGAISAKDLSTEQLRQLVEEFKRLGFKDQIKAGPRKARVADHLSARKARSLWISLHQLGVVENPSDLALEAFARRQLKVERLQWADQALCYKLVEALKAMAERAGWSQDMAGVAGAAARVRTLKVRLVQTQLAKLQAADFAPAGWSVTRAAKEFAGMDLAGLNFTSDGDLQLVAQAFGRVLHKAKAAEAAK